MQNFTIKEASEQSWLPESTLRYYESIGLIKWIRRDSSSGQRIYSEDDVNIISAIACLNATGLSISDMKSYLSNRNLWPEWAQAQIDLLLIQSKSLNRELRYIKTKKEYIDTKIEYWKAFASWNENRLNNAKDKSIELAKKLKIDKK